MSKLSELREQAAFARARVDDLFKGDKINHPTYLKLRESIDVLEGNLIRLACEAGVEYAITSPYGRPTLEEQTSGNTILYTNGIIYKWKD